MEREELLRSARNLYENAGTNEALKVMLEKTYPELNEKIESWTKEDKDIIDNLVTHLEVAYSPCDWLDKTLSWLKSLPKRLNLQPKTEWSERDETMFQSARWHLRNSINNGNITYPAGQIEDWLISLRNRPKASDTWKPSEEQMEALKWASKCPSAVNHQTFANLYDDLQKLL